jgi:hypothetical protein
MEPRLSRRSFVTASALGLAGLAGCNQQSNDSTQGTSIVEAHISNRNQEPRVVSVSFGRDDEIVYWENLRVEAFDDAANAQGTTTIPVGEFADSPAIWTIEALNTHTGEFATSTIGEDVSSEIRIDITVHPDNRIDIAHTQ